MASAGQGGWFRKKPSPQQPGLRVLTAAATRINLTDKNETARQMRLRQGWQLQAWGYRDQIGELRYALNFLANCAARMKIFPAAYPIGGESDNPVALTEIKGVPDEVIVACEQAMSDLGNGRLAVSGLMHSLSTNVSVAGEGWLLGMQDPETGRVVWSIRSISEIVIKDDKYFLSEVPTESQGILGQTELDMDETVLSRIWVPHPQYRLLADGALRAMRDDCESLLILRRMIRATGRSRLAGRGLLLVPEELDLKSLNEDNDDPQANDFLGDLTEAMMAPITDEGVAEAVVPILIRGPGALLAQVQHIDFAGEFDQQSQKVRDELIGVIATGLDLPKEIIQGVADLNHWSAWQVDDNTFRHHVEPHVITCCDGLTGAFFRPYLKAADVDDAWVQRVLCWYDPTELVTHPDRAADAKDLHTSMVISDKALRDAGGFDDADAPTDAELERRRLQDIRALPLNLLMEYARRGDPSLVVPPITVAGTVPGIKPGGVDVGALPPGPAAPAVPALPPGPSDPVGATPTPGPPPPDKPTPKPPAITASGSEANRRLSRKLAAIDTDLRARLQTAANAEMLRQLERSGAKLRTKVAKDETMRTKIAQRPNERVAAILGKEAVVAMGLPDLINQDWAALKSQFHEWTAAAQKQALALAVRIAGIDAASDPAKAAATSMAADRDSAWQTLSGSLTSLAHHLLYEPDPNTPAGSWGDLNPNTLVPVGAIRGALAIAGGAEASAVAVANTGAVTTTGFVGQIGTGATVADVITSNGGQREAWEWNHASTVLDPFEPHLALDGVQFEDFDDPVLTNPGDWPPVAQLLPGDHGSCTCDVMPIYLGPGE